MEVAVVLQSITMDFCHWQSGVSVALARWRVLTLANLSQGCSRQTDVENGPHSEKRKPGRPWKVPMVDDELSATDENLSETKLETDAVAEMAMVPFDEKRLPGRPRMVLVEPAVNKEVSVTSNDTIRTGEIPEGSGTHKRGKPKKMMTDNDVEDDKPPTTIKRGRGRPPKNKDITSIGKELETKGVAEKLAEKQEQGSQVTFVGPECAIGKEFE